MCITHHSAMPLTVKVTDEGHDLLLEFRVHSMSLLPFKGNLFKFGQNVHLREIVYRTSDLTMQTQGQGHC